MKTKTVLFGTVAIPVCVLDFWSKKWALTTLGSGPITDFMGGYVPLTLAFNKGAAFGIGTSGVHLGMFD